MGRARPHRPRLHPNLLLLLVSPPPSLPPFSIPNSPRPTHQLPLRAPPPPPRPDPLPRHGLARRPPRRARLQPEPDRVGHDDDQPVRGALLRQPVAVAGARAAVLAAAGQRRQLRQLLRRRAPADAAAHGHRAPE